VHGAQLEPSLYFLNRTVGVLPLYHAVVYASHWPRAALRIALQAAPVYGIVPDAGDTVPPAYRADQFPQGGA
jgi:hypothetical protein